MRKVFLGMHITGSLCRRPGVRHVLVAIFSASASIMLSSTIALGVAYDTTIECFDRNVPYPNAPGVPGYWYAGIETGSGFNYTYATEGAKGNLTTGGLPSTNDSAHQHVNVYLSANADPSHWVQTGWITGQFQQCSGPQSTGNEVEVYVEIYDDTSSPCYTALLGQAPENASYDGRFYSVTGSGMYEYHAYYQAPGSPNIQYLGYGDFNSLYTSEVATGEVLVEQNAPCPVLGATPFGYWNVLGNPNSNTFANYLQLYNNGSWANWTSGSAPSTSVYTNRPYLTQVISSYTEIENSGGQQ